MQKYEGQMIRGPVDDYESAPQEINLREYWEKIRRRKGTVLSVARRSSSWRTFWTFIQRPVYTAKGQLLIEKEPNILSFEQVFQIETMRDDFYQTQYRLLSGRAGRRRHRPAQALREPRVRRQARKAEEAPRPDRPRLPREPHRRLPGAAPGQAGAADAAGRGFVRRARPQARGRLRQRAGRRLHRPQHQHEVRGDRAGDEVPGRPDQGRCRRRSSRRGNSSRTSRPRPTSSP